MSYLDYVMGRLKKGLLTFINAVILANRSYPYHDYETATTIATEVTYRVGENNQRGNADQNKLFVSKSTLIYCTTNTHIILNSSENVVQLLLANTWYEFLSDIYMIHYYYASAAGTIYILTEGTSPHEARRPE